MRRIDAGDGRTRFDVGGPESALRRVELGERKHIAEYSRQLTDLDDAPSAQILWDVIADKRSHSKALKGLIAPTPKQPHRVSGLGHHLCGGGRLHPHHPPFFFMSRYAAVAAAAVISLIAHFAVGAAKSLITVRSWWSSGLEMTAVGALEGAITYAVGIELGHLGA